MKTLNASFSTFAALRNPDHTIRAPKGFDPDRTAYRCAGDWDYIFQEWPSREAWHRAYVAQGRALMHRTSKPTDWVPVHPQSA